MLKAANPVAEILQQALQIILDLDLTIGLPDYMLIN